MLCYFDESLIDLVKRVPINVGVKNDYVFNL